MEHATHTSRCARLTSEFPEKLMPHGVYRRSTFCSFRFISYLLFHQRWHPSLAPFHRCSQSKDPPVRRRNPSRAARSVSLDKTSSSPRGDFLAIARHCAMSPRPSKPHRGFPITPSDATSSHLENLFWINKDNLRR